MNKMLDVCRGFVHGVVHEQASYQHPRTNPLDAVRGVIHAVDLPGMRRVAKHGDEVTH